MARNEYKLPHDETTEHAVIGAVLMNHHLANELFSALEPNDFYLPFTRRAAHSIKRLMALGKKIDPITVHEEMSRDGAVEGGVRSLTKLMEGIPHFSTLEAYIDILRTKSLARQLIKFCETTAAQIMEEDMDAPRTLDGMIVSLVDFQGASGKRIVSAAEVAKGVKATFESWARGDREASGLRTGIPELDKRLRMRGLAKQEKTFIAARPSMGKTALLLQILRHAALLGVPIYFNSLEMGFDQLVMRMLSSMTGITNHSINPYTLQNGGYERGELMRAVEEFDLPIYFDQTFEYEQSIATAEHLIKTKGVQIVAYDYLQMFKTKDGLERKDPNKAYGAVAREFKQLALRNNVANIGLGQFSREVEKEVRRPRMSDNRDSGEIEQAVDTMLFPWDSNGKENRKNPGATKDIMWLDLYCEKQRNGARNWTVPLRYDKNRQTFESPEMCGEEPPKRERPDSDFANVVSRPVRDFTEPKHADDDDE